MGDTKIIRVLPLLEKYGDRDSSKHQRNIWFHTGVICKIILLTPVKCYIIFSHMPPSWSFCWKKKKYLQKYRLGKALKQIWKMRRLSFGFQQECTLHMLLWVFSSAGEGHREPGAFVLSSLIRLGDFQV